MIFVRFPIICKYNPFLPVADMYLTRMLSGIHYTSVESDSLSLPITSKPIGRRFVSKGK